MSESSQWIRDLLDAAKNHPTPEAVRLIEECGLLLKIKTASGSRLERIWLPALDDCEPLGCDRPGYHLVLPRSAFCV